MLEGAIGIEVIRHSKLLCSLLLPLLRKKWKINKQKQKEKEKEKKKCVPWPLFFASLKKKKEVKIQLNSGKTVILNSVK